MKFKTLNMRTDVFEMLSALSLNPDERYLYITLLYHERQSYTGIYEINPMEMIDRSGISRHRVFDCLERLCRLRLTFYDNALLFVPRIIDVSNMATSIHWPRAMEYAFKNYSAYRSEMPGAGAGSNQAFLAWIYTHAAAGRISADGTHLYVNSDGPRFNMPDWVRPLPETHSSPHNTATPRYPSATPPYQASQGIDNTDQQGNTQKQVLSTHDKGHSQGIDNTTDNTNVHSHKPKSERLGSYNTPQPSPYTTPTTHPGELSIKNSDLYSNVDEDAGGGVAGTTNGAHDTPISRASTATGDRRPITRSTARPVSENPPTLEEIEREMIAYRDAWMPPGVAILRTDAADVSATPPAGIAASEVRWRFPHFPYMDLFQEAAHFLEHYSRAEWKRTRGEPLTDWVSSAQRWMRECRRYDNLVPQQHNSENGNVERSRDERRRNRIQSTRGK